MSYHIYTEERSARVECIDTPISDPESSGMESTRPGEKAPIGPLIAIIFSNPHTHTHTQMYIG